MSPSMTRASGGSVLRRSVFSICAPITLGVEKEAVSVLCPLLKFITHCQTLQTGDALIQAWSSEAADLIYGERSIKVVFRAPGLIERPGKFCPVIPMAPIDFGQRA